MDITNWTFKLGDKVKKISGSEWSGRVVGFYNTDQTKEGYCIESDKHKNTVQLYPLKALTLIEDDFNLEKYTDSKKATPRVHNGGDVCIACEG